MSLAHFFFHFHSCDIKQQTVFKQDFRLLVAGKFGVDDDDDDDDDDEMGGDDDQKDDDDDDDDGDDDTVDDEEWNLS